MRTVKKIIILLALIAASASIGWSQDASALFKTKCAMCHGAEGQGKPKIAPKLAGIDKSEAAIVTMLTKGGAPKGIHMKPMAGMDAAHAKALATFVKSLK
ncbi:MAG: c-type cytochrome [Acidobacteriota bacterium]